MGLEKNVGRASEFVATAVGGERLQAFVPLPLPPDPPLRLDALYGLMEEANRSLGRLDGVTSIRVFLIFTV